MRRSDEDAYGINPDLDMDMGDSSEMEEELDDHLLREHFSTWRDDVCSELSGSQSESDDCDLYGEFSDAEQSERGGSTLDDVDGSVVDGTSHHREGGSLGEDEDGDGNCENLGRLVEINLDGGDVPPSGGDVDDDTMDCTGYHRDDVLQDYGHIERITLRDGRDPKEKEDPARPDRTILVPQVALFKYRGEGLSKLNYYEYLACVKFENLPILEKEDDEDEDEDEQRQNRRKRRTRRPQAAKFPMDTRFDGCNDCRHCIRTKQCTPLLSGTKPSHPGTEPCLDNGPEHEAWKLKADTYARYYLTLFLPGDLVDHISMDWVGLQTFVSRLQNDDNIISTFRLMMMHRHMRGLRTSDVVKKMTMEHKARSRTLWSEKQRAYHAAKKRMEEKTRAAFDLRAQDVLEQVTGRLPLHSNTEFSKQLRHDDDQVTSLMETIGTFDPGIRDVSSNVMSERTAAFLEQTVSEMHSWKKSMAELDIDVRGGSSVQLTADKVKRKRNQELDKCRDKLDQKGQNTQQLQLFDLYRTHFVHPDSPWETKPPFMALIHGPPGTGKSVIRNAIAEASRICGRFNIKTAFNGINAVEMGGHTTAHLVQLSSGKHMVKLGKIRADVIKSLQQDGFNTDSMVFIEECSTQAPWHLARLSYLCQRANQRDDAAFGGCLTAIFGDFNQLGPVMAGASITQAIMDIYADEVVRKWMNRNKNPSRSPQSKTILPSIRKEDDKYKETHPYTIGAGLMTSVRWFEMTQQRRSKDPRHTELVNKTYRGGRVTMQDLKARIQILSEEDCKETEWIGASVLTATNRERCSITHQRAIQYAKSTGNVVIRWLRDHRKWQQMPDPEFRAEAMDNPVFYEYYVHGYNGFLTESINRDLNLVNALGVRYRSIKFDREGEKFLEEVMKSASPGEVITMQHRPLCINVELMLPESTPEYVRKALWNFSVLGGKKKKKKKGRRKTVDRSKDVGEDEEEHGPVVPIYQRTCRWDTRPTVIHGGRGFLPSRAEFRQCFPVEPAFAITVHKAEGRTID